jgi:hypothetical protein
MVDPMCLRKVVVSPRVSWDRIVARASHRQIQGPIVPFDSTFEDLYDKSTMTTTHYRVNDKYVSRTSSGLQSQKGELAKIS